MVQPCWILLYTKCCKLVELTPRMNLSALLTVSNVAPTKSKFQSQNWSASGRKSRDAFHAQNNASLPLTYRQLKEIEKLFLVYALKWSHANCIIMACVPCAVCYQLNTWVVLMHFFDVRWHCARKEIKQLLTYFNVDFVKRHINIPWTIW